MDKKKLKKMLCQYSDLLEEVKDIKRRIEKIKDKLEEMETGDYVVSDSVEKGKRGKKALGSVKITGFPYPEYNHRRTLLFMQRLKLEEYENRLFKIVNELEDFINEIEDSRIRTIIRLRYIDKYSWIDIASVVGRGASPDSIRMEHNRFLDKIKYEP